MQTMATADWTRKERNGECLPQRRNLAGACLAHLLHDGYTDQLYALLPVWQPEFGLSYAGLAMVRALYYGTMGGLQLPADRLTAALSPRLALALATFIAAAGYLVVALPFGFPGLCIGLILAGVGSSVQHPRASLLVTNTYGKASRGPLGIYNFAGDLGKATFPAIVALLLPVVAWRPVVGLMALVGLIVAATLLVLVPQQALVVSAQEESETKGRNGRGFSLLLAIGACDTATRMGYLLFLPFLLHAKGGNEATIGIGLALIFTGGALGRFLQIARIEPFSEPTVHGSKQFAGLLWLPLVAPESRHAHCGAKFPGFGLLLTGNRTRALEILLRFRRIRLGRQQRDFACHTIDLGLVPTFLSCFDRRHRFADAAPSFVELTDFRIRTR